MNPNENPITDIIPQPFKSIKADNGLLNGQLKLQDGSILSIPVREDGMLNATELCKAGNKKLNDYQRNKQTQTFLQALESNTGIRICELIKSDVGGNHSGTWVIVK